MSSVHPEGTADPLLGTLADDAAGFLAAVGEEITLSLRYAANGRRRTIEGLPASVLDRRTRLEDLVDDLVRAGGKLVRPRVLFLGHLAVGPGCGHGCRERAEAAVADPQLVRLGSALELLHVFGLLQDDVMDEADTRRGAPTAHRAVAGRLAASRPAGPSEPSGPFESSEPSDPSKAREAAPDRSDDGLGEAARFGESLAVLAGDLVFALAQRQVRGLPACVGQAWDDAVLELVQGQRLDLVFAAQGRFDQPSTERVAAAKSGAYTVTRPLELGALLAAPHAAPPPWLTEFGEHVGLAFALADDVLGIWGDPEVTGKPVGDDLAQRKPTTVLGIADRLLDGLLHERLRPDLPAPSPAQVAELVAAMDAAGVRAEADRRISAHLEAANGLLEHVACAHVRAELAQLASKLALRPS